MTIAQSTGFDGIRRALGNPNFGVYSAGNAISTIGTWMQRVGVGWLAWELTQSPAWLGILAFANLIPSVFVGPLAGVIADRANRLRVVTVSIGLATLQAAALFALILGGSITIEILLVAVLFHGVVVGFAQPSRKALVVSLVPRGDLPTAVAINSIIFNLARFIGPAIAGVLIVTGGAATVFAVNACSFLAFLIALSRIRIEPEGQFLDRTGAGSIVDQMVAGIRYIAAHPGIGPMFMVYLAISFCARPLVELLPGFAAQTFGRGAETLAMLTSAMGLGAIVAGLSLARRGNAKGLTRMTFYGVTGLILSIPAFAATSQVWLGLGWMFLFGYFMVSTGVGIQTLIQLSVDPAMRGRVLAFHGILFRGGTALGALVVGVVSEWLGLRWSFAGGAAILLMVWIWAVRRRQTIATALEAE